MNMHLLKSSLMAKFAVAAPLALATVAAVSTDALAVTLKVTIESLAPIEGTFLTPTWVGFHDGTFDLYDRDVSLDGFGGMEELVEDGDNGPLSARFASEQASGVDGTIFGSDILPIAPGDVTSALFDVDPSNQYFSYAAMVLPSNDAFIANGNPLAFEIFDDMGNFVGTDFIVAGSQVLDGGTEVNDEAEFSTAFLGQTVPNSGTPEGGVVTEHPGFIDGGRILAAFPNGDFTADGYQVARITVEKVPEPATVMGLLALGGSMLAMGRRRKVGA